MIDISDSLLSIALQDNSGDDAPFSIASNISVKAVEIKPDNQSVVSSVKQAKDANTADIKKVQPPIKVPFDQGPRSVAPGTYKEPKKTVPTPAKEFVVDEKKPVVKATIPVKEEVVVEPKKPAPTLPLSLNKLRMSHQKLLTPPEPAKAELILLKDLKVRPLPKTIFKAAPLTGDANSKVFYITEFIPEISDYLQSIETAIAEFIGNVKVKSYKPSKNEVVLAFFEERYYRAVCRASSVVDGTRQYSVQFIDYGDVAQVTEESIRPFDKSLMFEVVTHSCKLLNMPTNEEDLMKLMDAGYLELKDAKESDAGEASYTANFVL